jgi:hypothetical protein
MTAHVDPAAHRSARAGTRARIARGALLRPRALATPARHAWIARISAPAWGAIAATAAFIGVTCWWLTQDSSIPIYDAGSQLETALVFHKMLAAGNLLGPFTYDETVYPFLGHLVGGVAALIAGASVAAPIVGENLVFVPLLALGCYQTGRLLFGPLAGLLAVVLVLGSPLVISMFHVFLLDGQLTALVAVAVWLILASEDFSRPHVAALAGLAVGLGMNIKVQFALFVVGLVVVVLAHGGWRNRRGFAIFAAIALAVGLPWYIDHLGRLGLMLELAGSRGTPADSIPPALSTANLGWYFWSVLNSQLLVPLFVLALVGVAWTLVTIARNPRAHPARLELTAAAFAAWLVITFVTPHHDIRYGLPLLAFVAVIATGWIAHVPRTPRLAGIAILAMGVLANTLGIDFGVGREVKVALVARLPATEQNSDQLVVYSTNGFLVSAPKRDGDVLGLLQALHREGVRTLSFSLEQSRLSDFSYAGLFPLAQIAGLTPVITQTSWGRPVPSVATLLHEPITATSVPTCTRLSDGTGVWVARYDRAAGKLAYYCPTHRPRYYDPGTIG